MNDIVEATLTNRHLEGFQNQFGSRMVRHRPTQDLPADGIQDDRQIHKAIRGPQEGDVGDTEPGWHGGGESRSTRSAAGRASLSRLVVTPFRRRLAPDIHKRLITADHQVDRSVNRWPKPEPQSALVVLVPAAEELVASQTYSQVGLISAAIRLSRSWEEGMWHAS
jgi:hypothetical protein